MFEHLVLPDAFPNDTTMANLVRGAVLLAGLRVPAVVEVLEKRDSTIAAAEGAPTARSWVFRFTHDGVALVPGGCTLTIRAGSREDGFLSCTLPEGDEPIGFEPFEISATDASQIAIQATEMTPALMDVSQVYVVSETTAQARYQIVMYDGRQEQLAIVSGSGEVIDHGPNEKPFAFDGYDLDYLAPGGYQAAISTPIAVGIDQTSHLDSAPKIDAVNCVGLEDEPPVSGYTRGFVVCRNELLPNPILITPPRPDDDFTNGAGIDGDPLGPQLHFLSDQLNPPIGVHGNLNVPAFPFDTPVNEDFELIYLGEEGGNQVRAPVHDAELQAFFNVGKLQKFYQLLLGPTVIRPDPLELDFSNAFADEEGQDHNRLELTVHWQKEPDAPTSAVNFNGARAGRFVFRMGDMVNVGPFGTLDHALDGVVDGSVFAHEYHHHAQERLSQVYKWQLLPSTAVLFPGQGAGSCPEEAPCNRRTQVLEGLCDAFGAIATNRKTIGTLALESEALPEPCTDNMNFGDGNVGPITRAICNNRAFGFWKVPNVPGDPCTQGPFTGSFDGRRRFVISGALYNYLKRFWEAEKSTTFAAFDILAAERELRSPEQGELHFFQEFLRHLSAQPHEGIRRYVHIARSAFAEKGIFNPDLHRILLGSTAEDSPYHPDCYSTNGCTDPLILALLTLAAGGPLTWNEEDGPPEFDLFSPPGDLYTEQAGQNVVELWLSEDPSFNSSATYSEPAQYSRIARINCAPPGFFRTRPSQAGWDQVVQAAIVRASETGTAPKVYYRIRLCLRDAPEDCVANWGGDAIPAYVEIRPSDAPGCLPTCGVARSTRADLVAAFSALALIAAACWRKRRNSW